MKVRMLVDFAGRKKGEIIHIPIGEAKSLVDRQHAEFVKESEVDRQAKRCIAGR